MTDLAGLDAGAPDGFGDHFRAQFGGRNVLQAAAKVADGSAAVRILSAVAILLASINVFGGFAVTRRMLAMFSKG